MDGTTAVRPNVADHAVGAVERRLVLSITRMTVHNGPGIRTLVLFKGCPLHCLWCSTPESQAPDPEISFSPDRCINCRRCSVVCPVGAIDFKGPILKIDRSRCNRCGACADGCPSQSITLLGKPMGVERLSEELCRDKVFYRHSGGGVTLSGGEVLLKPGFTGQLLRTLKNEGVGVGIDTCGHVPWASIEHLLPYIDFFLWDIKHMDPERHKERTGASNDLILSNLEAVSNRNIPVYVRMPVIPGFNDSEENIRATCEFVRDLPSLVEVDLLPLHHLGKARYASLDRPYPINDLHLVPEGVIEELRLLIESYGLKACVIN
jgi:pyruvate formate lyase activating enzyme